MGGDPGGEARPGNSVHPKEEGCIALRNIADAEFDKHGGGREGDRRAGATRENQLKEEIQTAVDKERSIWQKKQESLKWEMQSVRSDISRLEHQHSLREDMLRKEIADLQQVNLKLKILKFQLKFAKLVY